MQRNSVTFLTFCSSQWAISSAISFALMIIALIIYWQLIFCSKEK